MSEAEYTPVPPMKQCSQCKELLPHSAAYFVKDNRKSNGLGSPCRACQKKAHKASTTKHAAQLKIKRQQRYQANPDFYRKRSLHAYYKNPQKAQARAKKWKQDNAAHVAAYQQTWYKQNPTKGGEYAKTRLKKYPERIKARGRAYAKSHPEIFRTNGERRRARKKTALINDLTRKQWAGIKAHYGFRCVYCGKKPKRLTMDHIIPLSKGGNHTLSNIVPACSSCNSKKGIGAVPTPIQPLLLL